MPLTSTLICVFIQDNLKLVKLKRKLTGLNEFIDFKSYVKSIEERVVFDGDFILNYNETLMDRLMPLYEEYSKLFYLIEPLTVFYFK